MTADQLLHRNHLLDALTFHMRGFTATWIGARFNVTHQTASVWIKRAKSDPRMVEFARRRVEALAQKDES